MRQNTNTSAAFGKRFGKRKSAYVYARASLIAAIGTGLALTGVTVAQAATYTYVNNVLAPENQVYQSGNRASISGGYAATTPLSADGGPVTVTLETYRPYPGYVSLSYNTGSEVRTTHATFANASQQCVWSWPFEGGSIGSLEFTCRVFG